MTKKYTKAVMLSICLKWCEKIVNGKKTIEVRKTRPKLQTPFKCYIYCTMNHPYISVSCGKLDKLSYRTNTVGWCNSKVIGEFTCDRIYELAPLNHAPDDVEKQACMTREEIVNYLKGTGYGWHIVGLRIYDQPRELTAFRRLVIMTHTVRPAPCTATTTVSAKMGALTLRRPPQSWCYVDEG